MLNSNRPTDDNRVNAWFHVCRTARTRYRFQDNLFANNGKALIPDFHAARVFAQQMNQVHDLVLAPELAVFAGQINAVALLHGVTQFVFRLYCEQRNPQILHLASDWLDERFGRVALDELLTRFLDEFPPQSVYKHTTDNVTYLKGSTDGKSNREIVLEEILMLWISNSNPAFARFLELFDDDILEHRTAYVKMIANLHEFFDWMATQPPVKQSSFPTGENILHFLMAPIRANPHSLEAQLAYVLEHWGTLLGPYAYRLLRSLDLIKEEHRPSFGPGGPGPSLVPEFVGADFEPERFTPDRDWMPTLVLIAKNAYVWIDQLSKKYARPITRLDEIPNEELDMLARWGITGLWLIGLWERSKASQHIKQRMGNPEAVASAYSLFDYQIAEDLGGEAACNDLRQRAWRRGIRLASDMVPNHVGIDGKWVVEHPDWFVQLNYSPFPNYSFNGPNLSWDGRTGIYLEDHYYDRSDAAVVFKRVDHWTGDARFIYHGNDGTSMPWNDTAQLNYLHPDVREAMIQTILHVARQFPVIRFDAAMTLVKKHFQRLWFPEPGTGGAIPSRAEHGLTRSQFDDAMPEEFWREVVDRAAVEAPDTLLLAEAFWLMEGYFVRTLGMHRVYNSAFMNMLRDEENSKYRLVMKNTLEFDPEVLRRYVNFMNNPDERTAVDQFGKDGKYFGVCMLMVTMPGLPMIGHGQVEGFNEKYGMEYRRAYWDETPDGYLIERHEHEIFPLMRKRYLFAGVEHFLMYDFFTPEGPVDENVFAYSNQVGEERALVIYNNVYGNTRGWVRSSVAFSVKTGQGDERTLIQRTLADGLGLQSDPNQFCIFRDHRTGLEYIRSCKDLCEQGLYVELGGYEYHVFTDFRVVADNTLQQYRQIAAQLEGRGIPSIDEALRELYVQPVLVPFKALVNAKVFDDLLELRIVEPEQEPDVDLLDEVEQNIVALLEGIVSFTGERAVDADDAKIIEVTKDLRTKLEAILRLPMPEHSLLLEAISDAEIVEVLQQDLMVDKALWGGLLGWLFVHALGKVVEVEDADEQSRSWIDEWLLGKVIVNTLRELDVPDQAATQTLEAIKIATSHLQLFEGDSKEQPDQILITLLRDSEVQSFLGVNRYKEILWFNKEAFDRLMLWLLLVATVSASTVPVDEATAIVTTRYQIVETLRKAVDASGYQIERLRALVSQPDGGKRARRAKAKNRAARK